MNVFHQVSKKSMRNVVACNAPAARRLQILQLSVVLLAWPATVARAQAPRALQHASDPVSIEIGPGIIPLNGPWKFRVGDDPRWSDPHFDDSAWESVDLTPPPGAHDSDVGLKGYVPGWMSRGHREYRGFAWYRMLIYLTAPSRDTLSLAGPLEVDNAYELFVNGQRLGASGDFSRAVPVAYNTRPSMFVLPTPLSPAPSANRDAYVVAIRTWMEPGTGAVPPDAGGMHIAPAIGILSEIRARHQVEWTEKVLGYVVEVAEPISFMILAVMALSLLMFDRSAIAYIWLTVALVLLAMSRANQALFFWTTVESEHVYDLVRNVLLVPLLLGAWTLVWHAWVRRDRPTWMPYAIGALTLLYLVSQWCGRPWLAPSLPDRLIVSAHSVSNYLRLLFVATSIVIVSRGISRDRRVGLLVLPSVLLVSAGLYAQELSNLGVPGIWFPFGVGVSRTQFAFAAFDVFMFVELFRRLAEFAWRTRASAGVASGTVR